MRRSIRWRLSAYQIATLSLAMIVVAAVGERSVRAYYLARLEQHLARQTALARYVLSEPLKKGASAGDIQALVGTLGRETTARITVVRPDGSALADSLYPPETLANLGARTEIAAILKSGLTPPGRYTQAIRPDGMHVAVPVRYQAGLIAVVRASLSFEDLEAQLRELRILILGTVFLATIGAVVATLYVTRSIMGPIQEVADAALRMAGGDLTPRVVANRDDEIGLLTRSFNTMAERIHRMLAELESERGKMARVFTQMADGLVVADSEMRVLLMNPAAERLLGVSFADTAGRTLAEAIPGSALARVVAEAHTSGKERHAQAPGGGVEKQVLGVFAAPVAEHPGAPQGIMLVLHDLTETERTERIRREFVANASHELRTPIAAIKIMVESLLDGAQEDSDTRSRFLTLVEREADRLTGLVNDLLDLSQMDSGQWPLELVEFPLRETLEAVLAKFQVVAGEKRHQLMGKCHPEAHVWGDKRAVYQILSNLVSNAIRYSQEESEIAVTAETRGAVTRIRVRDTGIGITREDRERIFERFYRVDRARARELGGSGLGLAIVKHLVEAQGGKITVSSAPGKGSLFTVALPARSPGRKSGEEVAPARGST